MVKEIIKRRMIKDIIDELNCLRKAKLTINEAMSLGSALGKLTKIHNELPI